MPPSTLDPVATADHARRSLRLDPATLGLALVLDDPAVAGRAPRRRLAVLEAAGIAVPGADGGPAGLRPWCRALLEVVARAPHELVVEVAAAGSRCRVGIPVLGRRAAVIDHPRDGSVSIAELPSALVAARVAALVGLDPAAPAEVDGPSPSALTLARFHECLLEGDAPGAGAVLSHDGSIDTDGLRVLRDLAKGDGRAWRVTGGDRAVTAIATGEGGLWAATGPASLRAGMARARATTVFAAIDDTVSALTPFAGSPPAADSTPPPRPPCPPSAPTPPACSSSPAVSTSSTSA